MNSSRNAGDTTFIALINMESNHVDVKMDKKDRSIFTIFEKIISDGGRKGEHCISLIKYLQQSESSDETSSNLQYVVKRLVRGLGSARLTTQSGSFAALSCVLKTQSVSLDGVLEALDKDAEDAAKSEKGALKRACILACGAIVHSGLYGSESPDKQKLVLERFFSVKKAESYLLFLRYKFIIDAFRSVKKDHFKAVIWPVCKGQLHAPSDNTDLNELYFLLFSHRTNPKIVNKFLEKHNSSVEAIVEKVTSMLLTTSVKDDHPVYDCVGQFLGESKKLFLNLWSNYDTNMINKNKSILLVSSVLKHLKDCSVIPELLTSTFVETLIKVLTLQKRKNVEEDQCHLTGKLFLDKIVSLLSSENASDTERLETIKKLVCYPTNMKFEKKTGSKCVFLITLHLGTEAIKQLSEIYKGLIGGDLKKQIDDQGTVEEWHSKEKEFVMQTYVKLLNHPTVKNENIWKLEQIKFLFEIAFVKNEKISSDLQKCAKECFYKATELKMASLEDLLSLLYNLVEFANGKLKNKEIELEDSGISSWDKMLSTIHKHKKKSNKLIVAFHLLLIHMGFQLFTDRNLAETCIEDLITCYSHLKSKQNDSENPHWTEVFVDLLLSLLSKENRLWRHVVSCVFPPIVNVMTSDALHQIIEALGLQRDALKPEAEADSESEEGNESEESDESESSVSEGSEIDENMEEKANDQLRMAVRDALGYSAALTDDESVDMDNMDEAEEKRLNESLAQAFALFKANSHGKKKKQTKEEEALTHFRIRVLDLVEVYILNAPTVAGCLDLLLPLFELLELTIRDVHQRPLQIRVETILKKVAAVKKFASSEVTHDVIVDVFKALIARKEVSGLMYVEMAPRIADCCAFLVRCSQQVSDSEAPLAEEYNKLLNDFFKKKDNRLPISIFQSVLKSVWIGNWKLIKTLFGFLTDPEVRVFKKNQILELLLSFYHNDSLHNSATLQAKIQLTKKEKNFVKKFKLDDTAEKFVALFPSLIKMINVAQQSFNKHRRESAEPPPWKTLVEELIKLETHLNNKTRNQLATLAEQFQIDHFSQQTKQKEKQKQEKKEKKEKASEEKPREERPHKEILNGKEKKKKKKKKQNAEKMKMKKESIRLREVASSEGLETIHFSSVNAEELPEVYVEEQEETKKIPKKRKLNGNVGHEVRTKSKKALA